LVQKLASGAAARLGYSYEILANINPRIIVCDISGYRDDPTYPGPYRDKKAYDLLIQSEVGTPVPNLCREHGMSTATFYKWKSKYGGMDCSQYPRHETASF
jgi:itaconate CoA-transferase